MTSRVPLRPNKGNKYGDLTNEEMDCLTWMALTGKDKLSCYVTFVRPDLHRSKTADKWSKQFFAVADVRNYIADYQATLDDFFNPKEKRKELTAEDREKRKETAVQRFTDKVIDYVDTDEKLDGDTLTDQANLLNKAGMLKDIEEKIEPARRYLPERCNDCSYKKFIDEQVKLGNIREE